MSDLLKLPNALESFIYTFGERSRRSAKPKDIARTLYAQKSSLKKIMLKGPMPRDSICVGDSFKDFDVLEELCISAAALVEDSDATWVWDLEEILPKSLRIFRFYWYDVWKTIDWMRRIGVLLEEKERCCPFLE